MKNVTISNAPRVQATEGLIFSRKALGDFHVLATDVLEDMSMNNNLKGRHCVVFARGIVSGSDNKVEEQVQQMQLFCESSGMTVVDIVRLENVSADSRETGAAIERLMRRRQTHGDFNVLVAADLNRLARGSICLTMNTIRRLADSGIAVVTLADGTIGRSLYGPFIVRKKKGWLVQDAKDKAAGDPVRVSPNFVGRTHTSNGPRGRKSLHVRTEELPHAVGKAQDRPGRRTTWRTKTP